MATGKEATLEPITTVPDEGRRLKVRQSHIRSGGSTRINEKVRAELGIDARTVVEIAFHEKSIAVHLFADHHVDPGHIVVRHADMQRLGVTEGEEVLVRPLKPGRTAVREAFQRLGRRFEAGLSRSDDAEPDATKGGA